MGRGRNGLLLHPLDIPSGTADPSTRPCTKSSPKGLVSSQPHRRAERDPDLSSIFSPCHVQFHTFSKAVISEEMIPGMISHE